ncbi:hypothetical protein Pelo_15427 [Pelomyxa schiedti]|nr:hypothetical protein Pelo_15427 [Pelomyxa schiedti]
MSTASSAGTQGEPSLKGRTWSNNDPNKNGVVCMKFSDTTAQVRFCDSGERLEGASEKNSVLMCKYSVEDRVSPTRIHFHSGFMHGKGIFQLEGDKMLRLHMSDWSHPEEGCPGDFEVHPEMHYLLLELHAERQISLDGSWDDTAEEGRGLIFKGNKVSVRASHGPDPTEPMEYMVDSTTDPMQITIVSPQGEAPGIFELLDSDTLRICLCRVGPGERCRPKEFREADNCSLFTVRKRAENNA